MLLLLPPPYAGVATGGGGAFAGLEYSGGSVPNTMAISCTIVDRSELGHSQFERQGVRTCPEGST